MERRVVITGMGALTPVGNNIDEMWESLKQGKCGIDEITRFDTTDYKVKLAGELKNFNEEEYLEKKECRKLDKFSKYAIIAAREAWKDSGLDRETQDMERVATILGAGIGGIETIEQENKKLLTKGPDRISPLYIPTGIVNMAAGNVAIDLGTKGESIAIVTACATGTHCIGESFRIIRHGYQDIAVTGGTEASISPSSIAGFTNARALTKETNKNRASTPFDKERSGFVMGEGAGILILEELEHAKKRNAKIYAEIIGYAASSDAYHITSPLPDGEGGARAMKNAIKDAKIDPKEITYINAHGTSTHLNDACETKAIKTALGEENAKKVLVSSTKSSTGHMLGAAGAVEAIVCAKAIQESFVPATINYQVPDEECDLDIVPNEGRNVEVNYAMSNSLGFGGHNTSIVLKKYQD